MTPAGVSSCKIILRIKLFSSKTWEATVYNFFLSSIHFHVFWCPLLRRKRSSLQHRHFLCCYQLKHLPMFVFLSSKSVLSKQPECILFISFRFDAWTWQRAERDDFNRFFNDVWLTLFQQTLSQLKRVGSSAEICTKNVVQSLTWTFHGWSPETVAKSASISRVYWHEVYWLIHITELLHFHCMIALSTSLGAFRKPRSNPFQHMIHYVE